jgi:hypothetical protein
MKKTIMLLIVAALAIGVPVFGHATEDATNCVTSGTAAPTVPSGSTSQSLAPLDNSGVVWGKQTGPAAGELGVKGAHGWLKASGDLATQSGRIEGRESDVGLSGYVVVAGANSHVCLSAGGQKVKV